ncbi:MAG: hypothetical protein Ctma_0046 [Catillopecten margaritatus gill symbiont]|uniref:Cadherin domain-containing protein n=2 Tax=Catillopecten margaritatus gill symbiont TaxID=3083288 RepID=A0AAU6PEA8_9GAMM
MKTLLKNACSTNYNATNLITHVAWVGGAHSRALSRLKHFLAFGALTLSLNVTSGGEINQFDKEAYLNLGQQYSDNNTQVAVKEENTIDTLLKEIGSSVRNALGGTDSDNANQLGKKITDNLKNKANNTVINKTEGFINQKANELANSIGNGRTEISVHKLESNNPTYSLKTIQPLTELNTDSTELTFIQAQINSGENHGERRDTINLGLGQRYLLEGGQSIAGINLFTDYETESKHKRASLGLEYQRANFSANINKYYPLSDKKVIGDYTEEPLAGHDIKLTGQVPYLSWAKIKGTHYYWDAKVGDNIKGTILGVEIELNPSTTLEIGTENSNTAERASYARLSAQLPFKDGEALTNFKVSDQAFANSNIVTLTDLDFVERSNKIRIEKLLNGVSVVLGEYNALTVGSTCTLYNASNVAIANGSGVTGADGSVTLSNVVLPTGLISSSCNAIGTYIDEATGVTTTSSPVLRAAKIYSGTGDLILLASPLSEIAYQLANAGTLANDITTKNTQIATAFGISGVDFTATIPTDLNTITAANDDAGKFGTVLAAVSQMGENSADANPTITITALVVDMNGSDGSSVNTIEGRNSGSETVDVAEAINNFKNNNGDNNVKNGSGSGNTGLAGSATGEGSIKGNSAISKISNYDGTGAAPSVQQYVDAGVTGVNIGNLAQMNSRIATKTTVETDTTVEIQAVINTSVVATFTIDAIADTTVAENAAFTGSTPAVTGTPIGTLVYSLGGNDAADFTIDSGTGVISMVARDFEAPADANTDNAYEVTIIVTDADSNTDSETQTVTVTLASITIGTQTWSASNVSLVPTTNNVLGTDYWNAYVGTNGSGDTSDEDGYYYTWDAAMNVCPSGWSLPSDTDWKVLEGQLGMSVANQELTGWRGTDEGTKLKVGGSSGFEAKLAGSAVPLVVSTVVATSRTCGVVLSQVVMPTVATCTPVSPRCTAIPAIRRTGLVFAV